MRYRNNQLVKETAGNRIADVLSMLEHMNSERNPSTLLDTMRLCRHALEPVLDEVNDLELKEWLNRANALGKSILERFPEYQWTQDDFDCACRVIDLPRFKAEKFFRWLDARPGAHNAESLAMGGFTLLTESYDDTFPIYPLNYLKVL